jgi:AcrR family transcriptional regulator
MRKKTDTPLQAKDSNTTTKGYERASAILEAARLLLARDGYAALAMRSVAQQVGVSLSTVQHYYPSRDALIEALLEQTFARYQAGIDERVAAAGSGPRVELFESSTTSWPTCATRYPAGCFSRSPRWPTAIPSPPNCSTP